VTELIEQLLGTPTDALTDVLAAIEAWTLPRSDLNAWVRVLNKFDELLEDAVARYDLAHIQTTPFAPADKALLAGVLRFERLLLENTTNRKSFNSYDVSRRLCFFRVHTVGAHAGDCRGSTACSPPRISIS
jgi:E3 ubiquitin-protein ligase HUWE1